MHVSYSYSEARDSELRTVPALKVQKHAQGLCCRVERTVLTGSRSPGSLPSSIRLNSMKWRFLADPESLLALFKPMSPLLKCTRSMQSTVPSCKYTILIDYGNRKRVIYSHSDLFPCMFSYIINTIRCRKLKTIDTIFNQITGRKLK